MIRLARKNVPGAHFSLGNGKNLNQYENDFFDLVYSFVVFQHVDEADYQRPRGHPWLLRHYLRDEICKMLQICGFAQIRIFDIWGKPDPATVDESGFLFLAQK